MALADTPGSGTAEGLVGVTVTEITRHIRSHDLSPGDRLPSELHFSKNCNVSRTVVREAFRSLAAMRLIELSPGKRAVVARFDYGAMSPMIEHGVHTEQITVQQIYDVRRTIETRTATLAALRRSDSQGAHIVDRARAMRAAIDTPGDLMEHDIAFHVAIAKAACNPVFGLIVGAFDGVTRQTWPIGWRSRTTETQRIFMLDLHMGIAEAIDAGDPALASDLMAQHFDESVRALVAAGIA